MMSDNKSKVLKETWELSQTDARIHQKLQDRDRDPYLKREGTGYTYHPDEAQRQRDEDDKRDDEICRRLSQASDIPEEQSDDHINLRGITVMDGCMRPHLPGRFIMNDEGKQEHEPETIAGILKAVTSVNEEKMKELRKLTCLKIRNLADESMIVETNSLENRFRSITMFSTCGVDILWFGTAREMFNGIIGALIGKITIQIHCAM